MLTHGGSLRDASRGSLGQGNRDHHEADVGKQKKPGESLSTSPGHEERRNTPD
jgi:hypothetical protein